MNAPWIMPHVNEAQLRDMHDAALRIIAQVGFSVEHEALRRELLRHAQVREHEGRLSPTSDLVEAWVAQAQARPVSKPAPGPPVLEVWDRPLLMVDRDGRLRVPTQADVVWGTKLVAVLADRGVVGGGCAVPGDVPARLQPVEQFLLTARYAPAGGRTTQVTDIPTAAAVRELDRLYGRPHVRSAWLPSPMRLGGPEVDILWHFRGEVTALGVGTMPSMGLTGPCDYLAVYTLALAETIGAAALLSLVLPGVPIGIAPHPQPADMHTGGLLFGCAEWQLLDLMHRDIFAYYGQSWGRKDIITSAARPGWQAQADRAMGLMLGFANGYSLFAAGGSLAVDEIWSPAQLMLDVELVEAGAHVGRGSEAAPGLGSEALVAVVAEAVADSALFGALPSTLANLRSVYLPQKLTRRPTRAAQTGPAAQDLREAWAEADRLVAGYDYEPPADLLREVERACALVRERLARA